MGQIKVFGREDQLRSLRGTLSQLIHECVVEAFEVPRDKRFHRFFPIAKEDFLYPDGRSERYTIVEISVFQGRSVSAKKHLIRRLYERFEAELGLHPNDLEITIFETPRENWGIRGVPADELDLHYKIEV